MNTLSLNRRTAMKWLSAAPVFGAIATREVAGKLSAAVRKPASIDVYKRLYDTGGYSKAAVAYELALIYEANNQPDQAKDYYQKVVTEYPDSPFRTNADDALKRMGVTPTPPAPVQKPS